MRSIKSTKFAIPRFHCNRISCLIPTILCVSLKRPYITTVNQFVAISICDYHCLVSYLYGIITPQTFAITRFNCNIISCLFPISLCVSFKRLCITTLNQFISISIYDQSGLVSHIYGIIKSNTPSVQHWNYKSNESNWNWKIAYRNDISNYRH